MSNIPEYVLLSSSDDTAKAGTRGTLQAAFFVSEAVPVPQVAQPPTGRPEPKSHEPAHPLLEGSVLLYRGAGFEATYVEME